MNGSLSLTNVQLPCVIGVYPHERTTLQTLILDLTMAISIPVEDQLSKTIDYDTIVSVCKEVAENNYQLIESLASKLYERLNKQFSPTKLYLKLTKQLPDFSSSIELGEL